MTTLLGSIKKIPAVGVELQNFNINNINDNLITELNTLIMKEHLVLIRNINFSPEKFGSLITQLGLSRTFTMKQWQPSPTHPAAKASSLIENVMCVTGIKHKNGDPAGVFSHHEELGWHSNRSSQEQSEPIVVNYAASGTKESITSWCNCKKAYDDLSDKMKDQINPLIALMGFKTNTYTSEPVMTDNKHYIEKPFVIDLPLKGGKSLYFHFHQIFGFKNTKDHDFKGIIKFLKEHVLQDKYIYSHQWHNGDLIFHNQLTTIHKRHSCNTDKRLLFRSVYFPKF